VPSRAFAVIRSILGCDRREKLRLGHLPWAELRESVLEVTSLHFEEVLAKPRIIQLHFVKDELIAFEAA
jgi:hypothetical protein